MTVGVPSVIVSPADQALWAIPDLLDPALRSETAAAAFGVCERLRSWSVSVGPSGLGPGLTGGWAGLALLFEHADRCRPGSGWAKDARRVLGWCATQIAADPGAVAPAMASGWAGVAAATAYLSRGDSRYRRWREQMVPYLERAAADAAAVVAPGRRRWASCEFDLISGLAGITVGLLDAGAPAALDTVVAAVERGCAEDGSDPPWATAPEQLGRIASRDAYPSGALNLGLAHGLAGVVAALALAAGEAAAGTVALASVTSHLASAVQWRAGGPTVPNLRALDDPGERWQPGRTAWCYGPPGVARALSLAGPTLGRPELSGLAADLLVAGLEQPDQVARLGSPTFCHGLAGVLQVTARLASEWQDSRLSSAVPALCRRLLATRQDASAFGFRHLLPGGGPADRPGLLEGAAGVALVLMSISHPPAPGWDRALLLS